MKLVLISKLVFFILIKAYLKALFTVKHDKQLILYTFNMVSNSNKLDSLSIVFTQINVITLKTDY